MSSPLDALAKVVATCTSCKLFEKRCQAVFGRGNQRAPMMIIGEAPGQDEDRTGEPFVGRAGLRLAELLKAAHVPDDQIYYANVLKCFVGETLIDAPGIERGYKRRYDGPLVEVVTARRRLTGTPNHPVLTARGWIALEALMEGDDLICGSLREGVGLGEPDVENTPVRFDELFRALSLSGITERRVGAVEDFHGDGVEAEVEVVTQHGLLRNGIEPSFTQHLGEGSLYSSDHAHRALFGPRGAYSTQMQRLGRTLLPANSRVGSACERCAAGSVQAGQTKPQGVRPGAQGDPGACESRPEADLTGAEATRKSFEALASEVSLDRVVKVNRGRMLSAAGSTHVYNLQTTTGWYTANGVVVSNCRPPDNKFPENGPEVETCRKYLLSQIKEVDPKVVVLCGKQALKYVLLHGTDEQCDPIHPWVNKHYRRRDIHDDIRFLVVYHPAYLLRSEIPEDQEGWVQSVAQLWELARHKIVGTAPAPTSFVDIVAPAIPPRMGRNLFAQRRRPSE